MSKTTLNNISCIFCKIIARQMPAALLYEDNKILAFIDNRPVNEGHSLVISKKHAELVEELDEETFSRLFIVGRQIQLLIKNVYPEVTGFNYLIANGKDAGQEIYHVHLHIIPRKLSDGFGFKFGTNYGRILSENEKVQIAKRILNSQQKQNGENFRLNIQEWQAKIITMLHTDLAKCTIILDNVHSTNIYIHEQLSLPSGTIVIAQQQLTGKGQRNRRWISNKGGMYVSFKLKFPNNDENNTIKPFWVQTAISIGACKALAKLQLQPTIKWPNDILINGKKIAGLLGETQSGSEDYVIILGIGMNVTNNIDEIIAEFPELKGKITSVQKETNRTDIAILDILDSIEQTLDTYWNAGFPIEELKSLWKQYSSILGKMTTIHDTDGKSVSGKILEITNFGSLILEDANHNKQELVAGNVEIIIDEEKK